MAIEDEIINIADLDVGTELLKTDKLLIETNNGTKLLDFKDFVIGPDNISSVRDDQIEYETTGEAATRNSSTSFSIVTGFNILTTDTTPGLKTSYKDLSGSIELGKFNYNAIEHISTLSAGWNNLDDRFADLDSRVTEIQEKSNITTLSATNFKVSNSTNSGTSSKTATRGHVVFTNVDLNPTTTHTNGTLTFDSSPFAIKYPSTDWSRSWILFTGQFFFVPANSLSKFEAGFNLEIWKNGGRVGTSINEEGTRLAFNHLELVSPGDEIIVRANMKHATSENFGAGSFFAGFRLAGG